VGTLPRCNEVHHHGSEVGNAAESIQKIRTKNKKAGSPQRLTDFSLAAFLSRRFLLS
jgi:hypothetical protein